MQKKSSKELIAENQKLRVRLEEAQETLNAIRRGEVDGLIVSTPKGEQVYTISGADKPYRILIEEMREGAVMLSIDNTVLYCNSGFAKMIKRPIDKIVGSYIQNIVLPTRITDFEELLAQGRTGKGVKTKEITLLASDDKPVQTLMTISPFREGSNETTFLVATDLTEHMEEDIKRYTHDLETEITERKKAEEELRQSKEKYRQIVETAEEGIWTAKPDGTTIYVNQKMADMLGYTPEEIIGKVGNHFLAKGQESLVLAMRKELSTNARVQNEVQFLRKDGNILWTIANTAPIFEQGQHIGNIAMHTDITERKKVEEALRLSEARFSKAFSLSPFAIIMTRLSDGAYVDVNDTFLKMFEFSREEVIGHTANEIKIYAKPDGRGDYLAAFRNGRVSDFEVDLKTKTGKPLKALGFAEIININGQDLTIGTLVDVTERKKAEEALKASEKKANDLIKYAPSGIYEIDYRIPPKFRRVNDAMCQIIGYSREELLATSPFALLDDESKVRFQERIKKMLAGEKVDETVEFKVIRKDGREIFAVMNVQFTYRDGKPDGALVVAHDITERKKAEMALMEWAENLEIIVKERTKELELASSYTRSLIEASLDPLVTISSEGKITDVNRATEIATGCTREELIGSDFSDYFSEPDKARAGYLRVFTEGYVKDYPLSIRHKSGRLTDVLYNASIYRNSQGEIQGVFAGARDITERKQAEQKLKDAERLANIGATAGMVGHDIRNPLQAITSDVYLAKTELASTPESEEKNNALESLQEIEKNVDYINKIVADLQDFARPLNPHKEVTNLKRVIDDLLTKNSLPKNIKVSVKVETEKVVADSTFINRIMYNLVNNAVQAMPSGGKLTIHSFKEANDVIISVKDTGVGIPEAVKGKLFTPMFTTKAKGQGFGLAVIKRMTESLGGTVTFESQEGKGTTFTICLPQSSQQ
jgi:PAS domain S-box-containing protein